MKLQIAIRNEMLCGSVFFSLLKKFISKLEGLCAENGVCAIANIELGDVKEEDGRVLQQAKFDVRMADDRVIHISTSAKNLEDAIYNAFDECEMQVNAIQEKRA